MIKTLGALLLLMFFGCSSRKEVSSSRIAKDADYQNQFAIDLLGQEDAEKFLDRYYARLKDLQVPGLKPKEHYLNKNWPDKSKAMPLLESLIRERLDFLYNTFEHKIIAEGHSFYIKNNHRPKTLIFYPAPHAPLWGNIPFLMGAVEKLSEYNLVFVDNSQYLRPEKYKSLAEITQSINSDFEKLLSRPEIRGTKIDLMVICLGIHFIRDHLKQKQNDYGKLMVYAPMMKNIQKGSLLNPAALFGENDFFSMEYMVHVHNLIIRDTVYAYPIAKSTRLLNQKIWTEAYAAYESGISLDFYQKRYAFYSQDEEVVPHANSKIDSFPKSFNLRGAHLEVLYLEPYLGEFLGVVDTLSKD